MHFKMLFLVVLALASPLAADSESVSSKVSALESKMDPQTCRMVGKCAERALEHRTRRINRKIERLESHMQKMATKLTVNENEHQSVAIQNKIARIEKRIKSLQERLALCQKIQEATSETK